MGIKVLVVDDSVFFRRRVSEILNSHPQLEVIDTANNGKEALEKVQQLRPDVVTMDIEMPVMNGIDAAREIMRVRPTPILMFSSLTHEGAKATLDALDAGAVDFLPKKFEDIARDREEAITLLQQRVISISRHRVRPLLSQRPMTSSLSASRTPATSNSATPLRAAAPSAENRPVRPAALNTRRSGKVYQLVAIGTSTGGPVALQNILTKLPGNFPHPILLIQHMPATFTAAFASRLNNLCQINVKEAADGDVVQPGTAYLAPGGKQMVLDGRPGAMRIRILDGGERMNYKPCVDITFASCARQYRDKVLAV
ncbi:MAG TPA: chemotaxis response regulator protein-glutamate methylesterase, partial [Plesiomonas shigelloides]|nr:chemotaxis response regulator protein-glutamate methylesterase [Plesiomonas shigelloides]